MPKININGVVREMVPEDERYFPEIEMPPHEPTTEEKIAKLEEELKAAKILLGLEV